MANNNYATFPTELNQFNSQNQQYPIMNMGTPMGLNPTQPKQYPYQYFPQPQGAVYMIPASSDVNNIPITNGLSASICLPEGTMFIKTMQGGNPSMIGYKLIPLDNQMSTPSQAQDSQKNTNNLEEKLSKVLTSFDERLQSIEKTLKNPKEETEWKL